MAGDQQEHQHRDQLVVAEALTVLLRLDQGRDKVVAEMTATLLDERIAVVGELGSRFVGGG